MKTNKKNPRKKIENFSNIFMQLGLVLSLFIVFLAIEHKTAQTALHPKTIKNNNDKVYIFDDTPVLFKKEVPVKRPKIQKVRTTNFTEIIKKDNNDAKLVETIISEDVKPTILKDDDIIEFVTPEVIDDKDEPVNINFVSEIPIFAGCENLSKKDARKCFDRKLSKIVQRNFNTDLANELGLSSGKKRIFARFIIDKNGNISQINIKAPHPRLKKEAQRIVMKIPKFTPGKQNGKAIKVTYTLPIIFKVE